MINFKNNLNVTILYMKFVNITNKKNIIILFIIIIIFNLNIIPIKHKNIERYNLIGEGSCFYVYKNNNIVTKKFKGVHLFDYSEFTSSSEK